MDVDDDPSINLVVCAALKRIGLDVIDVDRGPKSIDRFSAEKPDNCIENFA